MVPALWENHINGIFDVQCVNGSFLHVPYMNPFPFLKLATCNITPRKREKNCARKEFFDVVLLFCYSTRQTSHLTYPSPLRLSKCTVYTWLLAHYPSVGRWIVALTEIGDSKGDLFVHPRNKSDLGRHDQHSSERRTRGGGTSRHILRHRHFGQHERGSRFCRNKAPCEGQPEPEVW